MINSPFKLLAPYQDRLQSAIFNKADAIVSGEYEAILKAFAVTEVAALKQNHGNTVIWSDMDIRKTHTGDALVTEKAGLILTIRWADCQNFLVYSSKHHTVALIHAGWRGVESNIIGALFADLQAKGIQADECIVCAGPSLCMHCADFSDPIAELPSVDAKFKNATHVDLRAAAEDQLWKAGVDPQKFERMAGCTRCSPDTWWTYRGGHKEEVKGGYTNVLAVMLRV
ncbi:MAG: polyphenol oxidase family protein [Candidatus Peribacteraceae bacterium]|nr:polyphenol oxidase family protein [Candidatus Peribacteraceae bacterium]